MQVCDGTKISIWGPYQELMLNILVFWSVNHDEPSFRISVPKIYVVEPKRFSTWSMATCTWLILQTILNLIPQLIYGWNQKGTQPNSSHNKTLEKEKVSTEQIELCLFTSLVIKDIKYHPNMCSFMICYSSISCSDKIGKWILLNRWFF